ncbi:MAG: hypothetical protein ACR2L2_15480 [Acidobacteriota bacterium]
MRRALFCIGFGLLLSVAWVAAQQAPAPDSRVTARVVILTEQELAQMLQDAAEEVTKGVEQTMVEFLSEDVLRLSVRIDFDKVGQEAGALTLLLPGRHELSVDLAFSASNGTGQVKVRALRVDGQQMPDVVADFLVRTAAGQLHPPVDISQPFALPRDIISIAVREKKMFVELK